jgi:hypothetical protein
MRAESRQIQRTNAGAGHNPLSVRLSADQRLELNVTSAFIELVITSLTLWSKEADRVKAGRGSDAPFRVRNRTGLTILLWPEVSDLNKPVTGVKRLDDGADVPWRFEDRKHQRDVSDLRETNCRHIDIPEHFCCATQCVWLAIAGYAVGVLTRYINRQGRRACAQPSPTTRQGLAPAYMRDQAGEQHQDHHLPVDRQY